jgi:hypothetical protein
MLTPDNIAADYLDQIAISALGRDSSLLSRAFLSVAPELKDWRPDGSIPFKSGISFDGCPLEASISLSNHEVFAVRFIVQPQDIPCISRGSALNRWVSLRTCIGIRHNAEVLDRLLSELSSHQIDARRSYSFWFGAELHRLGTGKAKLYINPWSFLDVTPGEVVAIIFKYCHISARVATAITARIAQLGSMMPFIVGFNINDSGYVEPKIYFVIGLTSCHELVSLLTESRVEEAGEVAKLLFNCLVDGRPSARLQVHVAMAATEDCMIKTNIYLSPQTLTALEGAYLVSSICNALGIDGAVIATLDSLLQTRSAYLCGRVAFIGLSGDKVDIYFRPF